MDFTLKSIFDKITTLHGTRYLIKKTGLQLYVWITIMFATLLLTISYILVIKTRFNNDQIITRINANCKVNQVPFPAVSICNFNIVSLKQTADISKILKSHNQSTQEIELFYKNLPFLTNFGKMRDKTGNFSRIMSILKKHYFSVDTLMEEVHQKCEDLLIYCEFNKITKNCADLFNLIKTYEGYCCAFNYAALKDVNVDELSNEEDIEYYIDSSTHEKTNSILVTSESGRGSGLSVVLNVQPRDYPDWSLSPYYGAKSYHPNTPTTNSGTTIDAIFTRYLDNVKTRTYVAYFTYHNDLVTIIPIQTTSNNILITDPNDYPEITVSYKYVKVGESLDIKVEPKIFQSEDGLRNVPIDKRGCTFHDESFLEYTDRYSTETCKTECRMKRYKEECGCVPYKYPTEASSRTCDFEDLDCLSNLRVHRNNENNTCKPVCYIECRDKKYSISSDVMPLLTEFYTKINNMNENRSEISSLQVYYAKSTCSCYKKMLLIDFNYFIVTYGGVFSLSFGASIITLFEIFYLLLSKLIKPLLRISNQ